MATHTFTITAIDGTKILLMLSYDSAPFPCIMIHEFKNGGWVGGPSYGDWYQDAINPVLKEMNLIGIKAWLRKYVCPWVKAALINTYGPRIGWKPPTPAPSPPDPAVEITMANVTTLVDAAIDQGRWLDVDNDGLPEFVIS